MARAAGSRRRCRIRPFLQSALAQSMRPGSSLPKSESLARDIVQDVFIQIWEKRHLALGIEHFESYINVVCRHMVVRELAKTDKRTEKHEQAAKTVTHHEILPDEAAEVRELAQRLDGLVSHLQKIFQLSRRDGLSHAEIAEQLGISKETVKNHLVRA